jgi:hypothetical protein
MPLSVKQYTSQGEFVVQYMFTSFKGTANNEELCSTIVLRGEWAHLAVAYDKLFRQVHADKSKPLNMQPYFCFNSAEAFTKRVYEISRFAGYPTKFFSGHSFRCGRVTFEATEACHGEENMDKFFAVFQKSQVLGGWMGDKVKVYIRNHVTKFRVRVRVSSPYLW